MSAAPQMTGYPTTGYPMTGYPTTGYAMPATTGYPMSYQPTYEQMTDRQVYTEQVTVPQQVTVQVPQTTYQARTVQVPQVQQVRVPRQTFETQTNYIQVSPSTRRVVLAGDPKNRNPRTASHAPSAR